MKTSEHRCSTACVRPIVDVYVELRLKIQSKLPGSPGVAASWSILHECAEAIDMGNLTLAEDDLPDYTRWTTHGQIQLASACIRKMADAFKVPVMRCDHR